MGVMYIIQEPHDLHKVKTNFGMTYEQLTERERRFYDLIAMRHHVAIIPDAVHRAYQKALHEGMIISPHMDFDEAYEIYKHGISYSTLKLRGIGKGPGLRERTELEYRDEQQNKVITHIDPYLYVFCDIPLYVSKHKKEDVKEATF